MDVERLKRRGKYFIIFIFLIVIFFLVINKVLSPTHYKTGTLIDGFTLKDINSKKFNLKPGNYNIIIFSKHFEKDFGLFKYINNLYEKKYADSGLNIFLIVPSSDGSIGNLKKEKDIHFPVLPFKENSRLVNKFFDPGSTDQALIIIDPAMVLESVYYFFTREDVRQLLEKHLLGTITYEDEIEPGFLGVGDIFPEISIKTLGAAGEQFTNTSNLGPRLWFIFGSDCVSCALNNYLLQYKLLEPKLSEKSKLPAALIFSPYFNKDELLEKIKHYQIHTLAYIAEDELEGIEDSYYKNAPGSKSIIVAATNNSNRIIYFSEFSNFVMELEGGQIEQALPQF